jgi:hypothetical protein
MVAAQRQPGKVVLKLLVDDRFGLLISLERGKQVSLYQRLVDNVVILLTRAG